MVRYINARWTCFPIDEWYYVQNILWLPYILIALFCARMTTMLASVIQRTCSSFDLSLSETIKPFVWHEVVHRLCTPTAHIHWRRCFHYTALLCSHINIDADVIAADDVVDGAVWTATDLMIFSSEVCILINFGIFIAMHFGNSQRSVFYCVNSPSERISLQYEIDSCRFVFIVRDTRI